MKHSTSPHRTGAMARAGFLPPPVPDAVARSDDEPYPLRWTPARKRYFLWRLADTGNVHGACREMDISRQSAYALRARDPVFARAWQGALIRHRDALVDICMERALVGATEEILMNGEIAERTRPDGAMLRHMLARADRLCNDSAIDNAPALESERQFEALVDCLDPDEAEAPDGEVPDRHRLLFEIERTGIPLKPNQRLEYTPPEEEEALPPARERLAAAIGELRGFASAHAAHEAAMRHPEIMVAHADDIDTDDLDVENFRFWTEEQMLRANCSMRFMFDEDGTPYEPEEEDWPDETEDEDWSAQTLSTSVN